LYRLGEGSAEADFPPRASTEARRTVYHLFSPDLANSVRAVEIDAAAAEATVNIELVPLAPKKIQMLDDAGQPLSGVQVVGVYPVSTQNTNEQFSTAQPLPTDAAEIFGLEMDGRRLVLLLHRERRLGKAVIADEQNTPSAQLEACATISGRVVDATGKPLTNQWVTASIADSDAPAPQDGRGWGRRSNFVQSQLLDKEGRFKLDLIIPGVRYRIETASGVAVDVPTVRAGESVDLGVLKTKESTEKWIAPR
jgi:hypothetical protein